jgi:periplasmic protein TonB
MTAIATARDDLARWAASAVVVVGLHAVGVATLLAWQDPVGWSDDASAIVIDLTPYAGPSDSEEDIAPGPLQQQAALPQQQAVEPKPEPEHDEKVEVPPAPVPPVAAVPPSSETVEPAPVAPPEPKAHPEPPSETPPAPATTAPPRPHPESAAAANGWYTGIRKQILRHRIYPATARARGEKGVVELAFSIDRRGRVVASRVTQASGFAALDNAALETLQKAQPFPLPPGNMPGEAFSFTLPLEFRIR